MHLIYSLTHWIPVTQSEQAGLLRDRGSGYTTDQHKPDMTTATCNPTSLEARFPGQDMEDGV